MLKNSVFFIFDLIGGQWIRVKCVLLIQLQVDCLIIVYGFKWMHTLKAICTYAWVDLTWVRHTRSNVEHSGAEALTPEINLSVCLSPTFFHSNDCCPSTHEVYCMHIWVWGWEGKLFQPSQHLDLWVRAWVEQTNVQWLLNHGSLLTEKVPL